MHQDINSTTDLKALCIVYLKPKTHLHMCTHKDTHTQYSCMHIVSSRGQLHDYFIYPNQLGNKRPHQVCHLQTPQLYQRICPVSITSK